MLRRGAIGVVLLLLISSIAFSETQDTEVLADLSETSLVMLNQELRSLRAKVNEVLPVSSGGTGSSSAANGANGVVILNGSAQLPAVSGALLTNLSAPAQLSTASGSAPSYSCRAWVKFDGTNTASFTGGNVASVTDNGTGDYTVVFTTAMADTNYAVVATTDYVAASNFHMIAVRPAGRATGSCQILVVNTSSVAEDSSDVNVAFFR